VFDGTSSSSESRFSQWLGVLIKKHTAQFVNVFGIAADMMGSHSFRKGIASFLTSLPGGPNPICIFLRAGWSLGQVASRYIFQSPGGDQVVGRVACGLPFNDSDFSLLPPHFDRDDILNNEQWRDICPNYGNLPDSFRSVLPFLLASLVYHKDWLLSSLPRTHPLFLSKVWTSHVMTLVQPHLLTGTGTCEITRMAASGIPPHIVITNRIHIMEISMDRLKLDMQRQFEVVAASFENLPKKLTAEMLSHFQVNGAVPLTETMVASMLTDFKADILSAIAGTSAASQARPPASQELLPVLPASQQSWNSYTWGGRIHPVPSDFVFPK
jgi:hypothetical protein